MAVLKHTSPTAKPVAPRPWPAITVPSASTSRPVNGASSQGLGVCAIMATSARRDSQGNLPCFRARGLFNGAYSMGPIRLGLLDWAYSTGPIQLGLFNWAYSTGPVRLDCSMGPARLGSARLGSARLGS